MNEANNVPNLSLGGIPKAGNRENHAGDPKTNKKVFTDTEPENNSSKDEVNMSVSPICMKDGAKVAYVRFTQGDKWAEGVIPHCDILKSEGYTQNECEALENYMKRELKELKKMAAGINVLDAIMGKR